MKQNFKVKDYKKTFKIVVLVVYFFVEGTLPTLYLIDKDGYSIKCYYLLLL